MLWSLIRFRSTAPPTDFGTAAVAVHTLAMLVVTALIAIVVYEWVGVAFLRRGWINLDRVWTGSLIATGLILLVTAGAPSH